MADEIQSSKSITRPMCSLLDISFDQRAARYRWLHQQNSALPPRAIKPRVRCSCNWPCAREEKQPSQHYRPQLSRSMSRSCDLILLRAPQRTHQPKTRSYVAHTICLSCSGRERESTGGITIPFLKCLSSYLSGYTKLGRGN